MTKHFSSYYTFLIGGLIIFTSCITINNRRLLSIENIQKSNETSIKLNGYYAKKVDSVNFNSAILFANGYIHQNNYLIKYVNNESTILFEKLLYEGRIIRNSKRKDAIWNWGIWWINSDSIFIEKFDNAAGNYVLSKQKGIITSDTSFIITSIYNGINKTLTTNLSQEYFFIQYENKPDSINYIQLNSEDFGKKQKTTANNG